MYLDLDHQLFSWSGCIVQIKRDILQHGTFKVVLINKVLVICKSLINKAVIYMLC